MITYKDKNFEAYCGGLFFTSRYNTSGEELSERAALGDPEALSAFRENGANPGELLKLLCYTLDPQIIIIGGSVSKSFSHYQKAFFKSMENYFFSASTTVVIKPSVT